MLKGERMDQDVRIDEAQVAEVETTPAVTDATPAADQPAAAQVAAQDSGQVAESGRSNVLDTQIAELRREAAAYRRRLREAEQLTAQLRQQLEQELAAREARIAELEAELLVARREAQERMLRAETLARATARGALHPELVWKALDLARVQFTEQGEPSNLDELLDELAQQYPALFAGAPRTSPANPHRPSQERSALYRREDLRDREYYRSHRDEIWNAFSEGRILNE